MAPLHDAIAALVHARIDVVLFTASVQLQHLLQVAEQMGVRDEVLNERPETASAELRALVMLCGLAEYLLLEADREPG